MDRHAHAAAISVAVTTPRPVDDEALLHAILAARRPDLPGGKVRFLEIGAGLLAGSRGGRGVLLSLDPDAATVPSAANSDTLVVDARGGLPSFAEIAALFSRHPLAGASSGGRDVSILASASVGALDVLSIGVDARADAICNWFDWSRVRPALVRIETGSAEAGTPCLAALGYRLTAVSPAGHIYACDAQGIDPAWQAAKPRIRTFDIFDTLIARRCLHPETMFEAIGVLIESPDFVALRKRAETEVYGDSYTLDDIYARFSALTGMPAEDAALLRNLELRLEIENALPIAENLAQVGPSDVLVSDMYLSAEQIRSLLAAAGFEGRNPILVRARGKHTGESWQDLTHAFTITQHLGDNRHADHDMALRHGVPAQLTSASNPTSIEEALAGSGFQRLARAMREARLRTQSQEPEIRRFQNLQIQINFPLLMIAGLHLASVVEAHRYDVALMASRDCNLWIRLIERLAAAGRFAARPVYLHANRALLRAPTPSYLRYVRSLGGERTLLVDLVGTGLSAQAFASRADIPLAAYLVHDLGGSDYAAHEAVRLGLRPVPVTHRLSRKDGPNADLIEAINDDVCGSLTDVAEIGATFVPRRDPTDLPDPALRRVRAMHEAFAACLAALEANGIDDMLPASHLESVGESLLGILHAQDIGILAAHRRQIEAAKSGLVA